MSEIDGMKELLERNLNEGNAKYVIAGIEALEGALATQGQMTQQLVKANISAKAQLTALQTTLMSWRDLYEIVEAKASSRAVGEIIGKLTPVIEELEKSTIMPVAANPSPDQSK